MHRYLALFCVSLLMLSSSVALAGKAEVGMRAPWFKLKSVTGKVITNKNLRGHPAVLVVGTSRKAAPLCKKWIYKALAAYGRKIHVYQVIVADSPWFIPNHVVIKKIKKMIDKKQLHRVLVEWFTVFADTYGVKRSDLPTVFVMDAKGKIKWRHEGVLTPQAFAKLRSMINVDIQTASR